MKRTRATTIHQYFTEGCGRCDLMGTPKCKVHRWHDVLHGLQLHLLANQDLHEEMKWGVPTYTFQGKNVVLLTAFKEYCALNFVKGALIKDPKGLLTQPTENTQAGRQFRFTTAAEVKKHSKAIDDFLKQAVALERTNQKVTLKKTEDFEVPEELQQAFKKDVAFKKAFKALTPGRQRGYLLYFGGAKQAATRAARIEKCKPDIFKGKGWNDR